MFGIDDGIEAVISAGLSTINKFIPDKSAAAAAAAEYQLAALNIAAKALADQRTINAAEAANTSLFVAGWRPAAGWLCVGTMAYSWIVTPLLTWVIVACGGQVPALPLLGATESQALLYSLLGLAGWRTVDKVAGKDTKKLSVK